MHKFSKMLTLLNQNHSFCMLIIGSSPTNYIETQTKVINTIKNASPHKKIIYLTHMATHFVHMVQTIYKTKLYIVSLHLSKKPLFYIFVNLYNFGSKQLIPTTKECCKEEKKDGKKIISSQ